VPGTSPALPCSKNPDMECLGLEHAPWMVGFPLLQQLCCRGARPTHRSDRTGAVAPVRSQCLLLRCFRMCFLACQPFCQEVFEILIAQKQLL
jgi:hypothetical protein